MTESAHSAQEIFMRAAEMESASDRAAYIDEACGSSDELRLRVERLLQAHFETASFLERPLVGPAGTFVGGPAAPDAERGNLDFGEFDAEREAAGILIDRYKLLQKIGEGGMGEVYMAEQQEPVQRKVAVKIIRAGMDSRQVVARFEAERQALALMDHENICRVLDAGTTGTGRPFFAMELVKGVPITRFCDENRLDVHERIALFVQVCRGVQHAHQKGIIHRDLKPSNVLVTMHDDRPVPKIIDFGVAKAVERRLTEKTLFTQFGQVVGTLEYMSPEQAQLNDLDVDTRSDVYALGVLLYELLTGGTPLGRETLKQKAFSEVLRSIREDEPPKPSTRLSGSGKSLPSISAQRKIDPRRLSALVRGDLDWIVMKALEKDRRRRYETSSAFARDLERYLTDDVVEARPPSALYRLKKYARRHRTAIATLSGFALLLCVGTVVSVLLAIRATNAEADVRELYIKEQAAHFDAVMARRAEREQRIVAENANAVSQNVNDFLRKDILGQANPFESNPPDLTLKQALDRASEKIGERFRKQPLVEAAIRLTIGSAYKALGQYGPAERHLQRAFDIRNKELGEAHVDTLTSANLLADLFDDQGKRATAKRHYLRNHDLCRKHLGDRHPQTLLAAHNLAYWYMNNGEGGRAEKMFLEALRLRTKLYGKKHEELLSTLNNLSALYFQRGDHANAETFLLQTLEIASRVWPVSHPSRLKVMVNLAGLMQVQNKVKEAERLLASVLKIQRKLLPKDHSDVLATLNSLAVIKGNLGDFAGSERLHRELLQAYTDTLGKNHAQTLLSKANVAWLERFQGRFAQAESKYKQILAVLAETGKADHPQVLFMKDQLAALYEHQRKFKTAEPLRRKIAEATGRVAGRNTLPYAVARMHYAENLLYQGRIDECDQEALQALAVVKSVNPNAFLRFHLWSIRGAVLTARKDYAGAERLLKDANEAFKAHNQTIQEKQLILSALQRIVRLYEAWKKPVQAAEWKARLNAARTSYRIPDPP